MIILCLPTILWIRSETGQTFKFCLSVLFIFPTSKSFILITTSPLKLHRHRHYHHLRPHVPTLSSCLQTRTSSTKPHRPHIRSPFDRLPSPRLLPRSIIQGQGRAKREPSTAKSSRLLHQARRTQVQISIAQLQPPPKRRLRTIRLSLD